MQHDWVSSRLGHGETMCARCFVTNREAAVLGMNDCAAPSPIPANSNQPQWPQDRIDEELSFDDMSSLNDQHEPGEECGRWRNGKLAQYCAKAGTEECDFECPYRDGECVKC